MKRLLREPLLHFVLLGAGLFLAYSLTPPGAPGAEPGRIVVTRGQLEHLALGFARTWQRPPTEEELAGLARDRVREEVYCREALALGLDKDDTVIRRRLRQKMEFVSDDIAAQAEPSEADLEAYLQAHPDVFRVAGLLTFQHVYLSPDKHRVSPTRDAAELLAQLTQAGADADVSALGDSFLLERQFTAVPPREIAKQFGEAFAESLGALEPGRWHGPLESGFGSHLVLVRERAQERLPPLAEVRAAVRREWDNVRRVEGNERFFQELLKRYTVTIESLPSSVPLPAPTDAPR